MAGDIHKTKTVAVTTQRINANTASFTNMGGQDVNSLDGSIVISNGTVNGTLGKTVGSTLNLNVGPNPAHVVATGPFTDGTSQVLLDTNI